MEGGSLELIEDMEDLILDTKKRLISAEDVNPFEKNQKQNAYLTQYFLTLYLFPLQQDFF